MKEGNLIIVALLLVLSLGLISIGFNNLNSYAVMEDRYEVRVGDSIDIGGRSFRLNNIGSAGEIEVSVDGVVDTVTKYEAESINGVGVDILRASYQTYQERGKAILRIVELDENEYFLSANKVLYFDNSDVVELDNVGSSGSIVVNVNGGVQTINAGATKKISGVEITNKKAFYDSTIIKRSAVIKVVIVD